MENRQYELTIDLAVLDHLADGLYSSVSAVLTEAVANAWDADAEEVHLHLDLENDKLIIHDDGNGMSPQDINTKYLTVGYRRRKDGTVSPKFKRPVMGRKGIGKLSLFSIADSIYLESKTDVAASPAALHISVPALRSCMNTDNNGDSNHERKVYHPTPSPAQHHEEISPHGTYILLKSLKPRLRDTSPESLRRRLARRFSVIGSDNFRVFINGVEVTPQDREDLKFVEYLWATDEFDTNGAQSMKKQFPLKNRAEDYSPP